MKSRYSILFLFSATSLVITLSSCRVSGVHDDFKLRRTHTDINTPTNIRTDGIYLRTSISDSDTVYKYRKFYEDGRFYISPLFSGSFNRADSLVLNSSGTKTYFQNEGDSFFYESYGGSYTGYTYTYGVANEHGLTITGYEARGWFTSRMPHVERSEFIEVSIIDSLGVW